MAKRFSTKFLCLGIILLCSWHLHADYYTNYEDDPEYADEMRDMEEIRNNPNSNYDDNGTYEDDDEDEDYDYDSEEDDSDEDYDDDEEYDESEEEEEEEEEEDSSEEYNNGQKYSVSNYRRDNNKYGYGNGYGYRHSYVYGHENSRQSSRVKPTRGVRYGFNLAMGQNLAKKKEEDPKCINIVFANTGETDIRVTAYNVQEWNGHDCNNDTKHYFFRETVAPGQMWWLKGWNSGRYPSGIEVKSKQGYKGIPGYYVQCVDKIEDFPFEHNLIRCRPSLNRPRGTELGLCNCTDSFH